MTSSKTGEESAPHKLEEAGCAVCVKLTLVSHLSRLKAVKNQLHVLKASGITRVEWWKAAVIHEFQGLVLNYKCNHICNKCHKHIRKNERPLHALVNGLWSGEVPEELATLSFVEKKLVAHVRVISCFVYVASSGLRKMAHMSLHLSHLFLRFIIAFPLP